MTIILVNPTGAVAYCSTLIWQVTQLQQEVEVLRKLVGGGEAREGDASPRS